MKFEKMVSDIVNFSQFITVSPLTREKVIQRFEETSSKYGEDVAMTAMKNTYDNFKKQAREIENKQWIKVKSELLKAKGSCPTSNRDLKQMIKKGKININGLESEEWIRETLNLPA